MNNNNTTTLINYVNNNNFSSNSFSISIAGNEMPIKTLKGITTISKEG